MQNELKMGVPGVRGIVGESLTPEVAENFARAFTTLLGDRKSVVVGTDTRTSRLEIKEAVIRGLTALGCKVTDIDIATTPTVQQTVRELHADGAMIVTASHNPIEWNGLKFVSPEGIFLSEEKMNKLFEIYHTKGFLADREGGALDKREDASELHVEKIIKKIDSEKIKNSKLTVVIDCCNGAGAVIDPIFFERLGVKVHFINEIPNGKFTHIPEPLPENLGDLKAKVLEHKADIGFAQDPDADRLAIVNEKGEAIGEEYTLALAMKYFLSTHPHPEGKKVIANLSTSKMFDDVAYEFGCKVMRTKIGEVYVSQAILDNGAIFGGEGNGGVIWPDIGYGRDSIAGMALILEYFAASGKKVSELVNEIPKYEVVKKKKEVGSRQEVEEILEKVKDIYKNESLDFTDGVKVSFENGWLHVRASNTEPIVRYFAEAPTREEAEEWIEKVI